jgi:hypothetical protein
MYMVMVVVLGSEAELSRDDGHSQAGKRSGAVA